MALPESSSDAPTIADDAAPGRDRAVDVARLAALVVVMFGHCALLLATIDSGGLRIGNLLGELPALAPITWVVQVMPLFFLAGGAAAAYGWRPGTAWGTWLFTRSQRLCRPVFWYLAAWVLGLLVDAADPRRGVRGGPRTRMRRAAVVPRRLLGGARVRARPDAAADGARRRGRRRCAARGRGGRGRDPARRRHAGGGGANFVVVWLIPVVIGVAYARRTDRAARGARRGRGRIRRAVALALAGPYEVSLVVTGRRAVVERVTADAAPRAALHVDVVRVRRRRGRDPAVGRAAAGLAGRRAGNGGAMTLYLWHIPAIAVATFTLHAAGFDAYDVHAPGFVGLFALRARRLRGRHGRWPSCCSRRWSIAGCRGGTRRSAPPVPGRPSPARWSASRVSRLI